MASDPLEQVHGLAVLVCPDDGPQLRDDAAVLDVIAAALDRGADLVLLPSRRLPEDFFVLRTRLAGEVVQKFANYRLRLAILGDISRHTAASPALRDFVAEANRGRHLWFVATRDELDERLRPRSGKPMQDRPNG
jgi:hypothetical protein